MLSPENERVEFWPAVNANSNDIANRQLHQTPLALMCVKASVIERESRKQFDAHSARK